MFKFILEVHEINHTNMNRFTPITNRSILCQ